MSKLSTVTFGYTITDTVLINDTTVWQQRLSTDSFSTLITTIDMDILLIFLIFVAGYAAGWFRASKHMLDRMLEKPEVVMELLKKYKAAKDEVDAEDAGTASTAVREIEIQKENSSFYLYAKDNGEFLGQGSTLDQALETVKQRFPGQNFAGHIPAEQAAAMGLSKQS
jgi:hypothetical protein